MSEGRENKWLLRKASGSRREWVRNGKYSDDRNTKSVHGEELPYNEAFKLAARFIDTKLVKAWLYSQVGLDFDTVYSAFIARVQPKYLDEYRECIYWYVTPWNQVTIKTDGFAYRVALAGRSHSMTDYLLPDSQQSSFYVHPETNILTVISGEQRKEAQRIMKAKRSE